MISDSAVRGKIPLDSMPKIKIVTGKLLLAQGSNQRPLDYKSNVQPIKLTGWTKVPHILLGIIIIIIMLLRSSLLLLVVVIF